MCLSLVAHFLSSTLSLSCFISYAFTKTWKWLWSCVLYWHTVTHLPILCSHKHTPSHTCHYKIVLQVVILESMTVLLLVFSWLQYHPFKHSQPLSPLFVGLSLLHVSFLSSFCPFYSTNNVCVHPYLCVTVHDLWTWLDFRLCLFCFMQFLYLDIYTAHSHVQV